MNWSALLIGLIGVVVGQVGGLTTALVLNDRQHRHQLERDEALARREHAWRAEEHFRPYFYEVLASARAVITAANDSTPDIGDIGLLDRCRDRFSSASLTRTLSDACSELKVCAVQFRGAVEHQQRLSADMREQTRDAAPLRPDLGAQVVGHGERLEELADRARLAGRAVQDAVRRVAAELEHVQRGWPPSVADGEGAR